MVFFALILSAIRALTGSRATDMDAVLGIACPNILFPYVREVISDIVVRAGFPPVMLNPVNFEAIFQAQREQAQSAAPQIITPTLSH